MSVWDITPESVLAAVLAGHDDAYELADYFGVLPKSHTLRSTIAELVEADRLVILGHRGAAAPIPILAVA